MVRLFAFSLAFLASAVVWAASPPDLVALKDGGMVRGTIIELVPSGEVTIELATGEIRTFPMTDVAYAGPADRVSTEAPVTEPSAPGADLAEVDFVGRPDQLQLFYHSSATQVAKSGFVWSGRSWEPVADHGGTYRPLCIAPCRTRLPAGRLNLGLAPSGRGVAASDTVDITGDGVVRAEYRDMSGVRIAGAVTGIAGGVIGMGIIFGALVAGIEDSAFGGTVTDVDEGLVVAGTGVMVAGGVAALIMLFQGDKAEISYERAPGAGAR
jgi:hypothetical protein